MMVTVCIPGGGLGGSPAVLASAPPGLVSLFDSESGFVGLGAAASGVLAGARGSVDTSTIGSPPSGSSTTPAQPTNSARQKPSAPAIAHRSSPGSPARPFPASPSGRLTGST